MLLSPLFQDLAAVLSGPLPIEAHARRALLEADADVALPPSEWKRWTLDDEIACEDLRVVDLNEDGKLDIVACGRASRDLRVLFGAEGSQ